MNVPSAFHIKTNIDNDSCAAPLGKGLSRLSQWLRHTPNTQGISRLDDLEVSCSCAILRFHGISL